MTAAGADPLLRRLERRALVFCAVAAALALWARGGCADVALGVMGGGALIGVSYWAIRSSIDGILALAMPTAGAGSEDRAQAGRPDEVAQAEPAGSGPASPDASGGPRRSRALGYAFRFIGRYAVLGLLAYVMLVWLRLHPVGMILGVSSIAVAAAIEAASAFSGTPRARG